MNDVSPAVELRVAANKLRPSSPAVAEHTVAVKLHPSIVEALADWLDSEADRWDAARSGSQATPSRDDHAARVARRILGEVPQ
jgi:hypothetical protein